MGGSSGTGGTAQNLEETIKKEYVACPSCDKKSALSDEASSAKQITCYNPKCKIYEPPKALIDVPFVMAIPFLQHCIATGPAGFYEEYMKNMIKLTEEANKK